MSATTSTKPERLDLDEVVQQLDYLTADVNRIGGTLDRIRLATTITAIASAITILGFVLGIVVGLVLGLTGVFSVTT